MKSFKLKRIIYKNIMSVGAKEIDISLDTHSRTLISGKNGASKSTMMEAITFALFGKPFRDIKKGQLINTFNKGKLLTELLLEYNGSEYYIKRGQKPNIFEVSKDGVPLLEASTVKDFQEELELMIGINYTTFKQVIILGTAGFTPFMGLSTPNRRKLVEDLLNISVITNMDKLNKSEIRSINQELDIINEKITSFNNQIQIYKDNNDKSKKLSFSQIERFETMKNELMVEAKGIKATIKDDGDKLLALVFPDTPSGTNALRAELSKIEAEYDSISKVKHLHSNGGSCPTCLQELHQDDSIKSKLDYNMSLLDDKRVSLNATLEKLELSIKEYQAIVEKDRELRNKINSARPMLVSMVDKIKKINSAIDKCKEETIDYSDQIRDLQTQRDEVSEKKTDLIVEKYHRGAITEMLKDSGIKGSIVNEYIPIFNKEINKYLKIMEADYVFTLDKEFNETIKSRGRETFTYNSFSQGEKARIDLALLFTWRDIAERISGIKLSCLFLDEVTDGSTDEEGIKAIQTILKSLKDTNIYVISHRGHNPDDYDRHIQMKKIGRFSEANLA